MQTITSLSSIAEKYDAFLLDIWGVIHDGTHLYPGAKACLEELKQHGKKSLFISNAPRRAAKVTNIMDQLGITPDLYVGAITSGETAFQALAKKEIQPGEKYYYIGPDKDADVLHGLDFAPMGKIANADFILNVGFGTEAQSLDNFANVLQEGKALDLPMLCLNPDLEVVKISGERYACAGAIALQYEKLGGLVHWYGKPYPAIYDLCLQKLSNVPKRRILAIGDGLHTDIAGAVNQNIDSLLVTGGILKGKTAWDSTAWDSDAKKPLYVTPELWW